MNIPLTIGRNSSGTSYTLNLFELPHLFISYNEEEQLATIFGHFLLEAANNPNTQFAVSLSRHLSGKLIPAIASDQLRFQFNHSYMPGQSINSIHEFITALHTEINSRKLTQRKHLPDKIIHPPLIVFIHDIFEVLTSKNGKTPRAFLELLAKGPAVAMHFIAGSSGIYKNLINQLINPTRALTNKTRERLHITEPLATQLIINPDGLIFFKDRFQDDFIRLYPN